MIQINRLKIIMLLSLLALLNEIVAQSKYQSHMWEITGNGLTKPSYLFGTMHVSNKVAFHLGDPFYDAIESCDYVALELEPDIWMHEMFKGDYFSKLMNRSFRYLGGNYGLNNGFSGNFTIETDVEVIITELLKSEDGFTNFMLTRSMRGNEDYEENSWLDMHIYQCAKKLKKKSFGLETFESSTANAERAAKEQFKDKDYFRKSEERLEMQTKMESAYRRGDLDFVDSLSRISYPGESYKYMLTDRNEDFVHTIDSLLKHGSLFAAMGCAHLPGKDGVIEMLRAMGYTVTPKAKGERDAKRKADIEKKIIERPVNHFKSEDGFISFDAPSEVFSLGANGSGIAYMSLDMPNGGVFLAQRTPWCSVIHQKNKSEMANAIEGLLYEKIKGEIQSQKRSTWNNYPCFDILSKNLRGQLTRLRIIVTETELIKLSVSAPNDLAKKGYGDFLFDTFNLSENVVSLAEKELFDGTFHATIPGNYTTYKADVELKVQGLVPTVISDGKDVTIVSKGAFSNPDFIDEYEYELSEFGRYFFNQTGFDDSLSTMIDWKNGKAIRAQYKGVNDLQTEALLIGNKFDYYAVQVITDNPKNAEAIFNSIIITDHIWPDKYHVHTDSTLMFCAELPWEPDPKDEDLNSLFGMFGGLSGMDEGKTDKYDVGKYKQGFQTYSDPEGLENIQVKYVRNSKYTKFYPYSFGNIKGLLSNEQSLLRSRSYGFNPMKDYAISDSSFHITPTGFEAENFYTDTLCRRGHRIKFILDDMNEYTITYVNDTDKLHNPLIDHFLETFTPLKDSVTGGLNIFSDKFDLILSGIQNPDTLEFEFARDHIYQIYPDNKEQYLKIKELETKLSPAAIEDDKLYLSKLWKEFQYHEPTDAMMESLTKEYNQNQDSALYQIQILRNLIEMETTKSRLRFKELMLKEPPIADYVDFLYMLDDSVEKIVNIIPSLLQLTQYEEYKLPIYEVLSSALDSNIVKPQAYSSKIPEILREAKLELKRTSTNSDENSDSNSLPKMPPLPPGMDGTTYQYDYDPNSYEYYDDYEEYSSLGMYLNLLEPHKNIADVAAFFTQVEEHKKEGVILEYAYFLKGKKKEVSDDIARKLIKEDKKLESINNLVNLDRTDLIPATWDVEHEYLMDQIKSNDYTYGYGYRGYDQENKVDSVQIDSTFEDNIKSRKYKVHFVRYKKGDSKDWTLAVAAYRIDQLDKKNVVPEGLLLSELSDNDAFSGLGLFGMGKSTPTKKDQSDDEKLGNLWLDLKFDQRNPYGGFNSSLYYPD